MDGRTKTLGGMALLIVGAVLMLAFALPSSAIPVGVPVPLAITAAFGLAAGTLLVGTSAGPV